MEDGFSCPRFPSGENRRGMAPRQEAPQRRANPYCIAIHKGPIDLPIRAVFFDAGDTLIHRWVLKGERFGWLCREAGIALPGGERALAGARAHERFFQQRQTHADRWSAAWHLRLMCAGLAGAGMEGDLEAMAMQIIRKAAGLPKSEMLDPDAVPVLEQLRASGYRLAVISNWDGTLVDVLRRRGLSGYFDAVLDSAVVGENKPGTRMYKIACAACGVSPAEAAHVGDSPGADVAGAMAAGVAPVLFDPLDAFDGEPGAARITRLSDLPEVLKQLGE
jgi:HAD superfamily hydrolase (TIGR01549 family)